MEGTRLEDRYGYLFADLARFARAENIIDENNIYQEANPQILEIFDKMIPEVIRPDSSIKGLENVTNFMDKVRGGKSGLVLCEHYSNFDLPAFSYMLRNMGNPDSADLANRLVAIAGMKLNEENPMVSAWAEAFTRIIIYPSRSLAAIHDPVKKAAEMQRSRKINMASMRYLDACRRRGQVILVFPSGTRYRPGVPDTKRGVREIDSYLRLTDIFLPVAMNGNCLRISEDDPKNMLHDRVVEDTLTFTIGKPVECKPYRNAILEKLGDDYDGDKKQVVVDDIMRILNEMHDIIGD